MQKKILSDQTLDELKITEKKQRSLFLLSILSFLIITGISAYLTIEDGITLYTLIPIIILPFVIYSLVHFRRVKDEIKSRTSHILHQKRMEENR